MLNIAGNKNRLWIGGNDLATKNRWVWSSTGYRMYPYVNWASDFPTGSGHCVAVDTDTWEWTDASCDEESTFICEFGNDVFTHKYVFVFVLFANQLTSYQMNILI